MDETSLKSVRAIFADRYRGALAAVALAALVYLDAIPLGFAWDDVEIIQSNGALHSWGALLHNLGQPYWPGPYGAASGLWRPLATTSWGLQWLIWGDTPYLFHAVGLIVHAVATGLVVLVLAELLPTATAVLAGLVFAVHPVHVEAVANVFGTADAMATAFVLTAALLHLRAGERYGWTRSVALGGLYAIGMLAKEIAVTLPALLFLLDAARDDIGVRELRAYVARRWRLYAVLAVVLSGFLLVRVGVLGALTPPQAPIGASLLGEMTRVWTVPSIWSHYARLMLFPADLSADYGGIIPVRFGWGVENLTGAFLALAILALAWWAWRTGGPLGERGSSGDRRVLGFAVVWFGLAVLPVANIFFLSGVLIAERNLYLASVGAAAAIGWLLMHLLQRNREFGTVAAGLVLALLSARTVTSNRVWNDTSGLFADLIERHPEVAHAWLFRGDALWREGRQPEARHAFSILLLLTDSNYVLATQVASRLSVMDRASPRAAEFLLRRAWRERPDLYQAPGLLAIHYLNHNQFVEGEAPARAAVALAPENPDMPRVLASLLTGQGRPAEAIPLRLQAIAAGGGTLWNPWYWLAGDYQAVGDTAAARVALDSARVRAPSADALAAVAARMSEIEAATEQR